MWKHGNDRQAPRVVLTPLLTALAVLVWYTPGLSDAWRYEQARGLDQAWRLLTCHWVHWTGGHLFWSGGAFLVLGAACEELGRWRYLVCVAASAVLIPAGLAYWTPDLATYGGLSGIDSAFFGMLAVAMARDSLAARRWYGVALVGLLCVGFAVKIGYEMVTGTAAFVGPTDAMVPVPLAHIIGMVVGLAVGAGGWWADRAAKRETWGGAVPDARRRLHPGTVSPHVTLR